MHPSSIIESPEQWLSFISQVAGSIVLAITDIERYTFTDRIPCRTSSLTGRAYLQELLDGSPERFKQVFRMQKPTFQYICTQLSTLGLEDTLNVSILEQFAMFLHIIAHGNSNRETQERYQHSGETVSRYILFFYNLTF